jgi:hypothetical protein
MRKLILILVVAAAAAVGIAAAFAASDNKASERAAAAPQRAQSARDEVGRVASALGLTGATRAALAKAQALGREATACLLAHGATPGPGGGLVGTPGEATEACAAKINANEAFLNSAEFAAVLNAAQPKFDAGASCFRRVSHVRAGTIVHPEDVTPDLKRRLDAAQATCYRPDGLPR